MGNLMPDLVGTAHVGLLAAADPIAAQPQLVQNPYSMLATQMPAPMEMPMAASAPKGKQVMDNPANWPKEASPELFVFYLPQEVKDEELNAMYAPFGKISRANVVGKKDGSGEHKGFGFVTFENT